MDHSRAGEQGYSRLREYSNKILQDIRYLTPHILSVLEEETERSLWDNLQVKPQKH